MMGQQIAKDDSIIELGKSTQIRSSLNKEIAILSFGNCLEMGSEVAEALDATLIDMNFVKPIDEERIKKISTEFKLIVSLEENVIKGGAGSAIAEILSQSNESAALLIMGLPDEFIDHGDQSQQKVLIGLNKDAVIGSIKEKLNSI